MYSFPPLAAAVGILYTAVTTLTTVLTPLLGAASAATAIVLLTMGVRLLLVPLGWRQARAERVRTRLAPKVRELRKRHRTDPQRLQRELVELYAAEGTSPLAGIAPALAQAPVFIALYGLFLVPEVGGQANALLQHSLAGVPLGARLPDVAAAPELLVFVVLFALLAAVAWGLRRLMPAGDVPAATVVRLLPFGTVAVAAVVPLAAGLYLLTTTGWTLAERTTLRRLVR